MKHVVDLPLPKNENSLLSEIDSGYCGQRKGRSENKGRKVFRSKAFFPNFVNIVCFKKIKISVSNTFNVICFRKGNFICF